MKAFAATASGVEHCAYTELPDPKPKDGETLVKLEASALNHLDVWIARGHPSYGTRTYPHVLGSDGAGVLEETGETVALFSGVSCGTCDACKRGLTSSCGSETFNAGQTIGVQRWGTHAEFISVPAQNAVPTTLEPEKAGCLSIGAVTAYAMLQKAGVRKGDRVLVWGASSSVGSFGIQIAKHLGASVITTASTAKKEHAEKIFGVPVIDYKTEDVAKRMRELTGGNGADAILDIVGPATMATNLNAVRKGGAIVCVGAISGGEVTIDLRKLYANQIRVIGSRHGTPDQFKRVLRWAEEGIIEPVIESTYPLSQAKKAFDQLAQGKAFGKIVLTR